MGRTIIRIMKVEETNNRVKKLVSVESQTSFFGDVLRLLVNVDAERIGHIVRQGNDQ